jgi:hypothetical protein
MRLSLMSIMMVAGVLIAPVPQKAAAAPVTIAAARIIPPLADGSITKIYYYRRGYYPYRYGAHYYRHRYYRYGRWHYY